MSDLGYHVLPEWFSPERLIEGLVLAEGAGFRIGWISDHFHPWFEKGVYCSFAWSILSAAAERTRTIKLGTCITAPILRYNPAVVAQAFATLGYLYDGRIVLGLGTGEALNEVPAGHKWPKHSERLERLEEAIKIIRLLWSGERVSFDGKYYKLNKARLYTTSRTQIPIYVAASGPKAAYLAGKLGAGLITLAGLGLEHIQNKIIPSFEKGLSENSDKKEKSTMIAEVISSYDENEEHALKFCRPFAATLLPLIFDANIFDPREIETYSWMIDPELIKDRWIVSSSPDQHIERIAKLMDLGFEHVEIVDVSPDHKKFIKFYAEKIIPYFTSERKTM